MFAADVAYYTDKYGAIKYGDGARYEGMMMNGNGVMVRVMVRVLW